MTRMVGNRLRLSALVAAVALLAALGSVGRVGATTDTFTVSATSTATLNFAVSTTSVAFGSALTPAGGGGGSGVTGLDGSSGNEGAWFLWQPGSANVTVESNTAWNGKITASENAGTATAVTIAGGDLRLVEGTTVPSTYTGASTAGFALTTTALATAWKNTEAAGSYSYTHNLLLRIDWNEAPGTFSSTITYDVVQV